MPPWVMESPRKAIFSPSLTAMSPAARERKSAAAIALIMSLPLSSTVFDHADHRRGLHKRVIGERPNHLLVAGDFEGVGALAFLSVEEVADEVIAVLQDLQ